MANIFLEDFDESQAAFDALWTPQTPPGKTLTPGGVVLSGNWNSCSGEVSYREFTSTPTINVNFVGCVKIAAGNGSEYIYIACPSITGGSPSFMVYVVNFTSAGRILFRMNNVLSAIQSSAGVVPTTGASFGLQVILERLSNFVVTYDFVVDNSSVWSGTFDWTAFAATITSTSDFYRVYLLSTYSGFTNTFGMDNLSVEDTLDYVDVEGVSYLSLVNGCSGAAANPVTVIRGSGLYTLDPTVRHDKLYRDTTTPTLIDHVKFPDPFATTSLIGDE